MKPSKYFAVTPLALVSLAVGCASEPAEPPRDPSYDARRSQELESERAEFIQEKREELSDVSEEIEELRTTINQQSSQADDQQRAEWSNALFELEQERNHLSAELDRASQANEEEWKVMRGDIPVAVDSLQAGVSKLGDDMKNLFTSERMLEADSGLCPVAVREVDTDVETNGDGVLVEIKTSKSEVAELQRRAMSLGKMTKYQPGRLAVVSSSTQTSGEGATRAAAPAQPEGSKQPEAKSEPAAEPIPLRQVAVQNIDDGVRVTFIASADDRGRLQERLSEDAERLEDGECKMASGEHAARE